MSTKAIPTPTPWTQTQIMDELYIHDKNGDSAYNVCKMIDRSGGIHHRNADLIVTAVNHHHELIDRLDNLVNAIGLQDPVNITLTTGLWRAMDDAIQTLKNVKI